MPTKRIGPGRPSNFGKVNKEAVELMCKRGFTDAETWKCLNVSEKTWTNWKKKNPKFYQSIKDWKDEADEPVERSLYERAKGYSCPETRAQWVESDVFDPSTKEFKRVGRWEYAELTKHYPPDPTSMIFWLKNRHPDRWRDKQDVAMNFPQFDAIQVIPVAPKKTDDGSEPKTT